MSWIKIGDLYVNLDKVTFVELKRLDEGIWIEFVNENGEMIYMYRIDYEDEERVHRALMYATKAVEVMLGAMVEMQESKKET